MKICASCHGANDTRWSKCRSCYNTYMRQYMQARWKERRAYGVALLGGRCIECGQTDNLEFDHIDRYTKNFTLAKGSSCSEAKFLAELVKCVLRCTPCHSERSRLQMQNEHGGGKTGIHKCKCEACKTRRRERVKEIR